MRIWVIGPIAWDSVLYLTSLPEVGSFRHAKSHEERPGGQALNIAVALANSGFDTGLIGYVGNDELGRELVRFIDSNLKAKQIAVFENPTPHVVIMVDEHGERTMVGMERSHFGEIKVDVNQIGPKDLVIWPIWRDGFEADFQKIKALGCRTIVGLSALKNHNIKADIAIGSKWELPEDFDISNYGKVIVTDNQNGAIQYSSSGEIHCSSQASNVVDATGAGDAFVCGIAKGLIENLDDKITLELASRWSAMAVSSQSSIPPALN